MSILSYFKSLMVIISIFLSMESMGRVQKRKCLSKKNTICKKMILLHPKMNHKKAYKLSNYFYKIAKKYKLSTNLLLAIAFQESRFKVDTIRKVRGFIFDKKTSNFKEMRVGSDFCMMQIHISNIKKMKLNTSKLLKEAKYCLETGAKILSRYKKKYSSTNKRWWTYYNAKTKAKRNIYFKHVTRHLTKLQFKTQRNKKWPRHLQETMGLDRSISSKK